MGYFGSDDSGIQESVTIQGTESNAVQNIAGGSGVIGGIVQSVTSPFLQKWSQDFARHEAGQAWERGMKSWHMQNEYNSPQARMQRLREAGLNPNLVYGKGNVGDTATGAPSGQKASQPPFQWDLSGLMAGMEVLNRYQDLRIKTEQANYAEFVQKGKGAQGLAAVTMAHAAIRTAYANAETAELKAQYQAVLNAIEMYKEELASEGVMSGIDFTQSRIVNQMSGPARETALNALAAINQLQKSLGVGFGAGYLKGARPKLKKVGNTGYYRNFRPGER